MRLIIALIGHISAGKSSTARIIARTLAAHYLAADDVVRDLGYANALRSLITTDSLAAIGEATTAEIRRRLAASAPDETIVLDAAPTVASLRRLLADYRACAHIILLHCDEATWRARELQRSDRFPLDNSSRLASLAAGHAANPDLSIDTSTRHPIDIAADILSWIRSVRTSH